MQSFDLIVIGAGSGLNISSAAAENGLKVAIVEKGPMGGTCLNRGCIPSKIIIHSADVIETINKAKIFGIDAKISSINFRKIISRSISIVDKSAKDIESAIIEDKNTTLFKTKGVFIAKKSIKVGNETIGGEKIIIAAGSRPSIPPIEGLIDSGFITSDDALRLKKQPGTLTILGGGYVATELAHFFGSMGTKIKIIESQKYLVPNEDFEVSLKLTEAFGKKYRLFTEHYAKRVLKKNGKFVVEAQSKNKDGKRELVISDALLVATGRVPNSDILDVKKTNVQTDEKGFIRVNDYLETTEENIWAFGDIIGRFLFKHSANLESECVFQNALGSKRMKVDYTAMPHAIFTWPQIAAVGLTQQELENRKIDYAVGKYKFIDSAMGTAINDEDGFVKIFADRNSRKILGCHIIGTDAPSIIHEVLVAMRSGLNTDAIEKTVHIHPALSEVVQRAVNNIRW